MIPRRALALLTLVLTPSIAAASEGSYKAEALDQAPPAALAGAVREALKPQGYRVVNDQGKPFANLWVRKETPASAKPAGPKGAVLFPFLEPGELLGALEFLAEGHDYRDQAIAPGVYTLRYGLQPVNGDHLGVSEFRDYALLVPAAKDQAVAVIPQKMLEKGSSEAAGSNHPAVMLLIAAPAGSAGKTATIHDEAKNLWGLVLPLSVKPKGESSAAPFSVQLIISGAAAT